MAKCVKKWYDKRHNVKIGAVCMNRDDIIIKKAIIHILDSTVGMPVLSDKELECGADLYDFFRAHLEKVTTSDDVKACTFYEDSEIKDELGMFESEDFVGFSQKLAAFLYSIMNANIEIPSADLAVLLFRCNERDFIGILKIIYIRLSLWQSIVKQESRWWYTKHSMEIIRSMLDLILCS